MTSIDDARARHYEVDRTPRVLVGALVARVAAALPIDDVRRFLDPSAGDGPWGEAVAERWPEAERVAVEPRLEERRQLRQSHHRVESQPFMEWAPEAVAASERFDFIATNPPFKRAFGVRPWLALLHELLAPGGVLVLYGKSSLGQTVRGAKLFKLFPPVLQVRVVGRVSHREHGRTDQHDVSAWCWRPSAPACDGWRTIQLESFGPLRVR